MIALISLVAVSVLNAAMPNLQEVARDYFKHNQGTFMSGISDQQIGGYVAVGTQNKKPHILLAVRFDTSGAVVNIERMDATDSATKSPIITSEIRIDENHNFSIFVQFANGESLFTNLEI